MIHCNEWSRKYGIDPAQVRAIQNDAIDGALKKIDEGGNRIGPNGVLHTGDLLHIYDDVASLKKMKERR